MCPEQTQDPTISETKNTKDSNKLYRMV